VSTRILHPTGLAKSFTLLQAGSAFTIVRMSAILSADDLNDFISPGVACIKPVETLPAAKPVDTSVSGHPKNLHNSFANKIIFRTVTKLRPKTLFLHLTCHPPKYHSPIASPAQAVSHLPKQFSSPFKVIPKS
jgi:hypothetical protein